MNLILWLSRLTMYAAVRLGRVWLGDATLLEHGRRRRLNASSELERMAGSIKAAAVVARDRRLFLTSRHR